MQAIKEKLLNEIGFGWNVMCRLFQPNIWMNPYFLVELNRQQMIEIENKVENSRPGKCSGGDLDNYLL